MRYLADLHIHSPYSRATSKESNLFGLSGWAAIKGIHLVGSGDFTHPAWFQHLKENLVPAEPGFFRLKSPADKTFAGINPEAIELRYVLSAEISSIYKRHGKVRKVHNLLYVSTFEDAARINAKLAAIGNIESDGRPILGLDSRNLLEILLENSENGFLVPAHIWTPWFSLFGSKSGFDSVEECFGDLSGHIFALETGLSSDPAMNRLLSSLDQYRLISNSDCHSPSKLGREANLFDTDFDFPGLRRALEEGTGGLAGTVEFFPEEGKYHYDGHRKCNVCLSPAESRELNNICPVCHKPLTIGVHNRVLELADRQQPLYPKAASSFHSLIPLPEILGEINGRRPASKLVQDHYRQAINQFGSEFNILLNAPLEELAGHNSLLAEAVGRMRRGEVIRKPGYDGEFGVIRVFANGELNRLRGQTTLFASIETPVVTEDNKSFSSGNGRSVAATLLQSEFSGKANPEQQQAIHSPAKNILVTAGPGTGKTFTLVHRLLYLIDCGRVMPQHAFLITFTNKAAEEISQRLATAIGEKAFAVFVGTFHQFCLFWLRQKQPNLRVVGPSERTVMLRRLFPNSSIADRQATADEVSNFFLTYPEAAHRATLTEPARRYMQAIEEEELLDLDGIIPFFLEQLNTDEHFAGRIQKTIGALLVDEFQDVNKAQYKLVCLLARHATTFAIGDPDQAIYGFRGSNPELFQQFAGLSPDGEQVTSITLHRNYRNAGKILFSAQKLISANHDHQQKELTACSNAEALLEYHLAATPEAEAQYIIQRVEETVGGISHFSINSGRGGNQERDRSFADIAILIRLNTQARVIRDALEKRGIPCQLVGLPPFFMEGDLKLACFWLLALAGLAETGEYLQLFAGLPGIGLGSLQKLENFALRGGDFLDPANLSSLLPRHGFASINHLIAALRSNRPQTGKLDIRHFLETGFSLLRIETDAEPVRRLLQLAGSFGTDLPAFARHLRRNATATVYDERAEAVSLMTIHGSKGLEFDTIFIAGLEEGILPHDTGGANLDLAEERRLMYVAITRARRQLILTGCRQRTFHGRTVQLAPSRFLNELPQEELQTRFGKTRPRTKAAKQLSLF